MYASQVTLSTNPFLKYRQANQPVRFGKTESSKSDQAIDDLKTIEAYQNNTLTQFSRLAEIDPEETAIGRLFLGNKPQKGAKILEAASGTGVYIRWLLKQGYDPYGIDAWKNAVNLAKQQYPELNNRLHIAYLSQIKEKFNKNEFDIVFSPGTVHNLPSKNAVEETVKNFKYLLKNKGIVFISIPEDTSIEPSLDKNRRDRIGRLYLDLNSQDLIKIFTENGFSLKEKRSYYPESEENWTALLFVKN